MHAQPSRVDSNVTPVDSQHTVTCRCCGQPIKVVPWFINGRDRSLITCENVGCGMEGYTFTVVDYNDVDLSIYC